MSETKIETKDRTCEQREVKSVSSKNARMNIKTVVKASKNNTIYK